MPSKTLQFSSGRHLAQLYANDESNLAVAEQKLGARILTRDDWLRLEGPEEAIARTEEFLHLLEQGRTQGLGLRSADFQRLLATYLGAEGPARLRTLFSEPVQLGTAKRSIVPKTIGQKLYLQAIQRNPIVFGIGPAGTGKTYLAMASAITALMRNEVQRVILTRPAVEAGENLGFLPGDLREKILPYLRPLYDAMHDLLAPEDAAKLAEKGIIEIAPLAYMRGRTLSGAFVILDEAQNTTPEQMMMFLTRLGDESRMVVTGDVTQIDLPRAKSSGLLQAPRILRGIAGIEVHHFSAVDVVRHPLVQRIIDAYDRAKASPADTARPGHPPPT